MTIPPETTSISRQFTWTISRIVAPELIDREYRDSPGRTTYMIHPAGGASHNLSEATRATISVGVGVGPVVGPIVGPASGSAVMGGEVGVAVVT